MYSSAGGGFVCVQTSPGLCLEPDHKVTVSFLRTSCLDLTSRRYFSCFFPRRNQSFDPTAKPAEQADRRQGGIGTAWVSGKRFSASHCLLSATVNRHLWLPALTKNSAATWTDHPQRSRQEKLLGTLALRRGGRIFVDRVEQNVRVNEYVRVHTTPHALSEVNCGTP